MNLELAGKRAIVTGGSRGIGKAVAAQLVGSGAAVAIVARDAAQLEAARAELSGERAQVMAVSADTTDDAAVTAMVDTAQSALGGVDILVNCAAPVAYLAPNPALADITAELLWQAMDVKVMGYLRCARAVAPLMIAAGWGRIVNVSGLAARQAGATLGSIRNAAVVALTKNLARELGGHGINVTCVHPGATRTERTAELFRRRADAEHSTVAAIEQAAADQTRIGRMVEARDIAEVVCFLASPRSVAIQGDVVTTAGGAGSTIVY